MLYLIFHTLDKEEEEMNKCFIGMIIGGCIAIVSSVATFVAIHLFRR